MTARAGIMVTVDAPGIQASTVSGVTTESFNELRPGIKTSYDSAIGEYSGQFAIVSADAYGGANGSNYFAVGAESHSSSTTLDLGQNRAYFGLFWSAGDSLNQISFYENSRLVMSFSTQDVIKTINQLADKADYYGNPNNGLDPNEPFAYLNFYGVQGTVFNEIVFSNANTGTGFECDNQSVRTSPVDTITGTLVGVPEPASVITLGCGIVGLALFKLFLRRPSPSLPC